MGAAVLVTGASGMIGRALVARLAARGLRTRALLRPGSPAPPGSDEVVRGDLTDPGPIEAAVEGVGAVVHLGAQVHRAATPAGMYVVNAGATRDLARAAARSGVERFVFFSTIAVYGPRASQPYRERGPTGPVDGYAASKLAAESLLLREAAGTPLAWTILRPSVVYGEHDRGNTLRLIHSIDRGWFVRIGDGGGLKSMTYVENVVDVVLLCLESGAAAGRILNVSDPRPYRLAEVAALISRALGRRQQTLSVPLRPALTAAGAVEAAARLVGRAPPVSRHDVAVLARDRVCSVDGLRRTLGYEGRIPLEEGIGRVVRWYRGERP